MWDGYGWTGGWMAPLMGVSTLLWCVLVVMLVIGVVRWLRLPQRTEQRGDAGAGTERPAVEREARQILDVRFAQGEIDADEYAERRRLLTGS